MTENARDPESPQGIVSAAELWQHLELGELDTVKLLDVGPRTVLLERDGMDRPLPVQGAPVLVADVACFPLPDVFAWIESADRSGFLHFDFKGQSKSVYLHQGEIVFANSNQLVDRLGESLLRAGVIQLDELREAQRAYLPSARLGKVLVERGFLTPRELWNGVKYQVEEIVRSLFAYVAGRVYFWEGEFQPDNVVRLSLPTRRLVAEGLQRRDELHRFLAVLEDPRVQLATVGSIDSEISGPERALVEAISEEPRFPGLCARLELDRESAARSLQLVRLVGAVKLVRSQESDTDADRPPEVDPAESQAVRDLVGGIVKVIAGLAEPVAVADGGADGIQERLGDTLADAASRFPGLLNGVSLGPGASLDPDVLVDRALRLPGDRENQVMAGLGELVAYLEFEIMNNPMVSDPEEALSGVAELRQQVGI